MMRGVVTLVFVLTALSIALPAADARSRCGGVANRIASNELVKIFETSTGTVHACWRATGRSTQLTSRAQKFRLGEIAGRHVAYTVFEDGAYIYMSVRRMDVRLRRLRVDVAATFAQAGIAEDDHGTVVDEVRLARSGVAWAARNSRLGNRWDIGYVPGGTIRRDPRIVASSPTYEVGSLALGRRYIYWSTADGTSQRAEY